ncbi:MAG: GDP-mannose 4,6-dehydratase [bacterium]|nr:GDP-mannose 4,6-dehydratase [bacterium]
MQKILITGGTGFAGTHLLKALQKRDTEDEIHLTSLHEHQLPGVQVHALNLIDAAAVEKLIQDIQPDQIYHLASLAGVADSFKDPQTVINNNFQLTLNVLEAVRKFAPQAKILLISSAEIYKPNLEGRPIAEDGLLEPSNPYAASKAAQDLLASAYGQSFNLNIVRARPFNHIGPGQNKGFVVADFASQIAAIEKDDQIHEIKVGNLKAARDFTDVDDMMRAYILLMEKGARGEVYNIGRGQAIKIQAILDQLLALAHKKIDVIIDQERLRPIDIPTIVADNRKIAALGWQAEVPLEETLAHILEDWRDKMV